MERRGASLRPTFSLWPTCTQRDGGMQEEWRLALQWRCKELGHCGLRAPLWTGPRPLPPLTSFRTPPALPPRRHPQRAAQGGEGGGGRQEDGQEGGAQRGALRRRGGCVPRARGGAPHGPHALRPSCSTRGRRMLRTRAPLPTPLPGAPSHATHARARPVYTFNAPKPHAPPLSPGPLPSPHPHPQPPPHLKRRPGRLRL